MSTYLLICILSRCFKSNYFDSSAIYKLFGVSPSAEWRGQVSVWTSLGYVDSLHILCACLCGVGEIRLDNSPHAPPIKLLDLLNHFMFVFVRGRRDKVRQQPPRPPLPSPIKLLDLLKKYIMKYQA